MSLSLNVTFETKLDNNEYECSCHLFNDVDDIGVRFSFQWKKWILCFFLEEMLEYIPKLNKYIADLKIQAIESTNYMLHPIVCDIFQSITIHYQICPSSRYTQDHFNNNVTSKAILIRLLKNDVITHCPNDILFHQVQF